MPKAGWKPYSGVDDGAHLSDGARGAKKDCHPYKAYGGVDPMSATHGSGKAGKAKPGGRAMRSRKA
jgi:hypothetical protein